MQFTPRRARSEGVTSEVAAISSDNRGWSCYRFRQSWSFCMLAVRRGWKVFCVCVKGRRGPWEEKPPHSLPLPQPLILSATYPPTPLRGTAASAPPHGECLLISCVLHASPQPPPTPPWHCRHLTFTCAGAVSDKAGSSCEGGNPLESPHPISATYSRSSLFFCRAPSTISPPFVAPSRLLLSGSRHFPVLRGFV